MSWGRTFTGGSGRAYYCVGDYFPYGNDGRFNFNTQVLPLVNMITTTPTSSSRSSSIIATASSTLRPSTQSSSSSSTSNVATCRDLIGYETLCTVFSSPQYGYCTNTYAYVGGLVFSKACLKSCGLCTITSTCNDSVATCSSWANYCYLLASLNPHPCKATCKLC